MTDSKTSQEPLKAPALVIDSHARTTTLITTAGSYVANWSSSERAGNSWLAHFGAGVVGDSLWPYNRPISDTWSCLRRQDLVLRWGDSARGAMCLFGLWPNGDWVVCPDAVGAAPAYYCSNDRVTIISASIPTLTAVASRYDIELTVEPGFMLEVALLANGGIFPASRQGVDRTAPFEFLQGQLGEFHKYVLPHRDRLFEPEPPADLLHEFVEDVVANVSAALSDDAPASQICQLTGGLDSRVILGAILHTGLVEGVELFSGGPKGTRDRDIGHKLAGVVGLPSTSDSGLGSLKFELELHEHALSSIE